MSPSGERICWFINFADKVTQDSTIYGQMQFLTQGRKSRFWPSRQKMYLVDKYFLSLLIWLSKIWLHRWKTSNVFFALHTGSNNEEALKAKVKKDGNQLDRYIWTTKFNALIFFCPGQKFLFKRKQVYEWNTCKILFYSGSHFQFLFGNATILCCYMPSW